MNKIKHISTIILATGLFLTSCSDEFLDLKPIARDTEESFYKDFDAINATATAAYATLCAREVFDKDYYLTIGSIPSDDAECGGENVDDYPEAQHYDQFGHDKADKGAPEEIWRYCYKGIRFCNTAIEKAGKLVTNEPSQNTDSLKALIGEVKFLRAFYHFTLVQVFGGVPIVDKMIQQSDFSMPRNSISQVLAFCVENLQQAAQVLPPTQSELGRVTKGAANSLLARVLIFESSYAKNYAGDERFKGCQERWQEALTAAQAVISSNVYSLVDGQFPSWRALPPSTTVDGFRFLFTVGGDNSKEGIFEIQNVDDNLGWGVTRGNSLTVFSTARKYNNGASVADIGGWSFNCPTDFLVKSFQNSDPRETNLNSAPCLETDDPRFKTTVGRNGDSILIGSTNSWVTMNLDNCPTKMIGRKFECSFTEYWHHDWPHGPFNIRLIRYADVLLLGAEAAVMLNNQSVALDYVNQVRTRARNSGTTGYPQNLTAISLDDVKHERRLELALEPHRFFDIVRWGDAEKFISGIPNGARGATYTTTFVKGKHEFWPIPQSEIDLSKGGLKQYPAWE